MSWGGVGTIADNHFPVCINHQALPRIINHNYLGGSLWRELVDLDDVCACHHQVPLPAPEEVDVDAMLHPRRRVTGPH